MKNQDLGLPGTQSTTLKKLIKALIASGIFNFLLIFFIISQNLFGYRLKDNKQDVTVSENVEKPLKEFFTGSIGAMELLPASDLIAFLSETNTYYHGYRVADLAVSILVTRDYFDLERACGRSFVFNKIMWNGRTWLFPEGLRIIDFQLCQDFVGKEAFPYTIKGMLEMIASMGQNKCAPGLLECFCHTEEFLELVKIIPKDAGVEGIRHLLNMVLTAGWGLFEASVKKATCRELSLKEIQKSIFRDYMELGSQDAALFFLMTDFDYVVHLASENEILILLNLVHEDEPLLQALAREIVTVGLRGKEVLSKAKKATQLQEKIEIRISEQIARNVKKNFKEHKVRSGESLWLIAKKYRLSVKELMVFNQRSSEKLLPGEVIHIPI